MNSRRYFFSLTEVIVAMGIFAILMTLLLQFFAGAQKLWQSTESKNQLYSDARVAMTLMANTLQSIYYEPGHSYFRLERSGTNNPDAAIDMEEEKHIFFAARYPVSLDYENADGADDKLYFMGFRYVPTAKNSTEKLGELHLVSRKVTGDIISAANDAYSDLKNSKSEESKVIGGVTGFDIVPIYPEKDRSEQWSLDKYLTEIPPSVEIRLAIMNKENFDKYKELSGEAQKKFRQQHEYRFNRIIFLQRTF